MVFWQSRRDARYSALAVLIVAAGMYVHMELGPLLLALPVTWYLYRPPLSTKWVLAAASVSILIWFPYLRYEASRDVKDISSVVFGTDIMPPDSGRLLCDPTLRE